MTDVAVFTGRDARSATLERLAAPSSAGPFAGADLEGQFKIATAIANSADAVPRHYRRQPGAVLLALAWSQQHGLDILTTIQNVSFIDGKAVVDATMQRALAKSAGYLIGVTVGPDYATVALEQNGTEVGVATYSMSDAERANLTGKTNWQRNPEDMLVARATARAVRRFAPDVLLGMVVAEEMDDEPADVLDLVPPPAEPEPDPAADSEGVPAPEADESPEGDTTAVAPAGVSDAWVTVDDMRRDMKARGITTAAMVREAQESAKALDVVTPAGTLGAIFGHPSPELRAALFAWVRNHDVTEP